MCGITGTYNYKQAPLPQAYTQACLATMQRRGPDSQDIWHNGENYITGFARLAIRDRSVLGNQPMLSADKRYCLSYNGEVYNTEELKIKLAPFSCTYHSTSDTEVLLYALIFLGIQKTLQLADGMFAFAFYDNLEHKLVLARDRMGIKPLYIGSAAAGVVYSSQYDHLIHHPFIHHEAFNLQAIATYLMLGYMPAGSAVLQHTTMLPHGHMAVIHQGCMHIEQYYSYGIQNMPQQHSLHDVLQQGVQSQLVSDVPAGTFMSGGTDSTLVSHFANRHTPVQSYTIGVTDDTMDETAAAATFAHLFGTCHHSRYLSAADLLPLINSHAAAFSEPFADYSSLPTLLLSQFAKTGITVALSGDGGDELFWGYARSRKALDAIKLYKKKKGYRQASLLLNKIKQPGTTDVSRHWSCAGFVEYAASTMHITGAAKWLGKVYREKPDTPFFLQTAHQLYNTEMDDTDHMNLLRKMELDLHLPRILQKVDRASMYHSLEVRVPMLGNKMLELSRSYNHNACISKEGNKMPLRNLLGTVAGSQLAMQPKKGFSVPVNSWIRCELQKEIKETILDMPPALSAAFHIKGLEKLLHAHITNGHNEGWFIWAIYALVKWHHTHVLNSPIKA